MQSDIYDLKAFYTSKVGRVVRRVMQERIRRFWPDMKGYRLLGGGYAVPYLRSYKAESERTLVMMTPDQGCTHWPHDEKNCVFLSNSAQLPIETNSVDRVILMHDLEYSSTPANDLDEIWRVLKSNGRALIIVPNRTGFWSHADWTPFGHGTPFSMTQICRALQKHRFVVERSEEALFLPPIKFTPILKSAGIFERLGPKIAPFTAGVHMVEVAKQLYAKIEPERGSPVAAKAPKFFAPKPAAARNARLKD
ncbi:MAG: class I SAM-dependent methyltransferase [Micavibrio sp.]|nr:class I SAM-dependent methyltransferase [Micavibrio sp.]